MISCEGEEVRLGAKAKVKTGGKFHMDYLANFVKKPALTNIFLVSKRTGCLIACDFI